MQTILALNAGSSSLKFSLFAADRLDAPLLRGQASGLTGGRGKPATFRLSGGSASPADREIRLAENPHADALAAVLAALTERYGDMEIAAVGHRVVHGGGGFEGPVRIDDEVVRRLESLVPLAPLHQPHNLAGIAAARKAFPGATQVASFDTAFHRTQDAVNDMYALPRRYYEAGVRRYGFHGLSYASVLRRLRLLDPGAADGRLVVAHLGNGCSMCAIRDGRAVATTMGFSPLDGLAMGTRTGRLDPSVVLYLARSEGLSLDAIEDLLFRRSGLLGISGITSDMRELEDAGTPDSELAIAYFSAAARREIGALAATLGGLDALVLTGGIGENSARVRREITLAMDWLGIALDGDRNERGGAGVISRPGSRVTVLVVPTDEEAEIAREALTLLAG